MNCVILYVSEDHKTASLIAGKLTARGINSSLLQVDNIEILEIADLVGQPDRAVALLSPNSFNDDNFNSAVAAVDSVDADIYTVRLGDAEFSNNLRYFLQWSQWLDLTSETGTEAYDFLAQTIISGKSFDKAKRFPGRQKLWRRIVVGIAGFAVVSAIVSGGILWRIAELTEKAEEQAARKAEELLRPPNGFALTSAGSGGNPWIDDPKMTLWLSTIARQRSGIEIGIYEPFSSSEKTWKKTAEFKGVPTAAYGYQSVELRVLKEPKNGNVCLIYGRDVGGGLLRQQYAIFRVNPKDSHVALDLDKYGLAAEGDVSCDNLVEGKIDSASLNALAEHQRFLDVHASRSYIAPYRIDTSVSNTLKFSTHTLGSGAQTPADATIFVFERDSEADSWSALARISLADAYPTLKGASPAQLLVCADTHMPDINTHIAVTHRFAQSGTTYQTQKEFAPQMRNAESPCLAFLAYGEKFPVTTETDWVEFLIPTESGWKGDTPSLQNFQLGAVHIGQQKEEATAAATAAISGIVRTTNRRTFLDIMNGPAQPVFESVFLDTQRDNVVHLIGNNDQQGIALQYEVSTQRVTKIFYAARPEILAYKRNRNILNNEIWSDRIEGTYGSGSLNLRSGDQKSNNEFALKFWGVAGTPCEGSTFSYNLGLDSLTGDGGCVPHAGAVFLRNYDNLTVLGWATVIDRSNAKN